MFAARRAKHPGGREGQFLCLCGEQLLDLTEDRTDNSTWTIRFRRASVTPLCLAGSIISQRVGDALCGLECHSITVGRAPPTDPIFLTIHRFQEYK